MKKKCLKDRLMFKTARNSENCLTTFINFYESCVLENVRYFESILSHFNYFDTQIFRCKGKVTF